MIVFGIPEGGDETDAALKESVAKNIFEENMKVSVACFGRKQENRACPIIQSLYGFNEVQLLRNARALMYTRVSIFEDYSRRVREIGKYL